MNTHLFSTCLLSTDHTPLADSQTNGVQGHIIGQDTPKAPAVPALFQPGGRERHPRGTPVRANSFPTSRKAGHLKEVQSQGPVLCSFPALNPAGPQAAGTATHTLDVILALLMSARPPLSETRTFYPQATESLWQNSHEARGVHGRPSSHLHFPNSSLSLEINGFNAKVQNGCNACF